MSNTAAPAYDGREGSAMYEYYFTFRSVTRAQMAAQQLSLIGLRSALVRIPNAVAAQGCGYAVRVRQTDLYAAVDALQSAGVVYERVFGLGYDGLAEEVLL